MEDRTAGPPASVSTAEADDHFGRRVTRKVFWRLMPLLMLLYFVNYLDRVNIGFAGPNGMNAELGLSEAAFGLASGIFFIGYLLLEVPSNLALHRFGARKWLTRIMVTWGIVASATAFVPNGTTLIVLRFVLGVAEAGFFPGIILYLTYWFPAEFRVRAVGMFMVAVPISTAIGSTASSLIIAGGDGLFGLSGWRVMFLVEGIPALLLAVVTFVFLTDRPEDARWLSPDERGWLRRRLDGEAAAVAAGEHWTLRRALTHRRIVALAFVYFGVTYGLYALGFFLPTIVAGFEKQFGTKLDTVEKGLVTSIPYVVAAVAMVLWSRAADRAATRTSGFLPGPDGRRWWIALPMIIGGLSIMIALYLQDPWSAMAAVTVCAVGVCAGLPTFWPLPSEFLTGAAAAGGIALINSLGNISGFAAPYITGGLAKLTLSQRPGLWVVGSVMVIGAVVALVVARSPRPTAAVDRA